MNRGRSIAAGFALAIAVVAVRAVHLSADPPAWLSWSAGIYTDEGFYAADARQAVMTGHWSAGNFHGAIVSPVLYWLQLAAFHCFGPSLVAARGVSVVCGSLTVLLLFVALKRLYGDRTAWIGAVLLGFSTPFVFYNRLALMETPAAMLMTTALVCLAYCSRPVATTVAWSCNRNVEQDEIERTPGGRWWLAALAGVFVGFALATKVLLAPAMLGIALWAYRRGRRLAFAGVAAGVALPLILTAFFWNAPYLSQLREMDRYYWLHQFSPQSLGAIASNVERAWITGKRDGLAPTLMAIEPFLLVFGVCGTSVAIRKKTDGDRLLVGWQLGMVAALTFSAYTPSRYDVMFMPALAGLAARFIAVPGKLPQSLIIAIYAVAELVWIGPALMHPSHTVRNSSARLAAVSPAGGVILGQTAPELCMDTKLTPVIVQPGLANDNLPIERFGASFVLVTRSQYWDNWWRARYPLVERPANCMETLKVGPNLLVDVYRMPAPAKETLHGL